MCGIVGYVGTQQAAPLLLDGLRRLEYRGYDSAGMAVCGGGGLQVRKAPGRLKVLEERVHGGADLNGTVGIGHTRWATHGEPNEINAHPQTSGDGKFAVVHNGIIENYAPLKQELIRQGCTFVSETDTEVVAELLAYGYRQCGDVFEAVNRMLSKVEGTYALGILCADTPDRIIAARKDAPLLLGFGQGENFLASDVTALLCHTRDVVYMDDGELAIITAGGVRIYDERRRPIEKEHHHIDWDVDAAEKGGYDHFMLKEIMEQPRAVEATITPRIRNGEIVLDDLNIDLSQIHKIVITACGSAYYAGCAGKYTIEKLCRIPVTTELASELRYADPLIDEHTLLIVLSQSGETADTIAAMKECQRRGAKALAIVNVVGSTIAKIADYTLYTWAGPEIAVATTKGYTTQLTVLYLFALYAAKSVGTVNGKEYKRLLTALRCLPKQMQAALDMNPAIPALAMKYHGSPSMFFIGRNTDYAVALEGALKMKEISYIHAESYAAGELKHGTIALIYEGQPVIALCCNDAVMEKTMSNIVEVKARGAEVLAVAFKGNGKIVSLADDMIFVPKIDPLLCAVAEIVPLQLLAYYVAKENGCDIDKPKNLAKSVTVE